MINEGLPSSEDAGKDVAKLKSSHIIHIDDD